MPAAALFMCFPKLSHDLYPRRVVVLDWPGAGLSSRSRFDWAGQQWRVERAHHFANENATSADIDFPSMAEPFFPPLEAALGCLDIRNKNFVLMGHSLGGYISISWLYWREFQRNKQAEGKNLPAYQCSQLILASPCGLPTLPTHLSEKKYR